MTMVTTTATTATAATTTAMDDNRDDNRENGYDNRDNEPTGILPAEEPTDAPVSGNMMPPPTSLPSSAAVRQEATMAPNTPPMTQPSLAAPHPQADKPSTPQEDEIGMPPPSPSPPPSTPVTLVVLMCLNTPPLTQRELAAPYPQSDPGGTPPPMTLPPHLNERTPTPPNSLSPYPRTMVNTPQASPDTLTRWGYASKPTQPPHPEDVNNCDSSRDEYSRLRVLVPETTRKYKSGFSIVQVLAVTGAPQSPLGPNDSASQVAARQDIDSQVSSAISRPSTTSPRKRCQKQPITYDDDDVTDSLAPEEENILRRSRRDWYSNCYQSFEKAQIQHDAIGKVVQTKAEDGQTYTNYVFKCKVCGKFVTRHSGSKTTSNLVKHAKICNVGDDVRSQQLMSGFSSGSNEKLRTLALCWVASCHRLMSIVGDSEFPAIVKLLNPQAVVPSQNTVTQDIKIMYSLAKVNLKSILQKTKGAVHIALDVWTDINMTVVAV
ncbi:hypothetical protein EDB84DRAFT_1573015 [Lactarius hengduanensis]|nr:hypothetical protein EDB84DRAFT_1573015 [Lactarius hengduanensis]